ncbi:hypothetical protein BIW11_03730, partial [Tropilaelaps mercedesae]
MATASAAKGQEISDAPPAPPPPPPPPPPPGWKPNWREERAKEEAPRQTVFPERSAAIQIPSGNGALPAAPLSPKPAAGSGPDGSFMQYDLLPEKLQSTLSKDKKPFTYTPAGIDLSEIKSPKFQKKVNRAKQQGEFSPVCGPGSPGLNEYGQQPPLWPDDIQDISEYCNNPSELDESMTNPRYTGSKIPSRSFKVLQAITATSDDDYASSPEPSHHKESALSPKSGLAPSLPSPPSLYAAPSSAAPPSFVPSSNSSSFTSPIAPPIPPPPAPSAFSYAPPFSGAYSSVPPPVPPPPLSYAPAPSLYSQPAPTYKRVPPPVPPKPPRGIFRNDGRDSLASMMTSLPGTPLGGPPATPLPPLPPLTFTPPRTPVPTPSRRPFAPASSSTEFRAQPFSEQFYQSTANPVFKTYTPPPSVRQTVRSGPGYKETTTHRTGPGFEEATTYSTYSTPSYSDGTRTLPLRREVRSTTTKSSFKSRPYYESPYQTLLDTPQFQDPYKFGGMTPSYTNPYTDQSRKEPFSTSMRKDPFFASTQATPLSSQQ